MKLLMKGRCDMIPVPLGWRWFSAAAKCKRSINIRQSTVIYKEFWSKIDQSRKSRGNKAQVTHRIRQER